MLNFAKDQGFYILLEKYYLADVGYVADNPLILILY